MRFEDAEIQAYQHIIHILQEELPYTLESIRDKNLHLPAPDRDAYYLVKSDPVDMVKNHPVTCILYPVTEMNFHDPGENRLRTTSREGIKSLVSWQVGITLLFRKGLYDPAKPVKIGSHVIKASEIPQIRVYRYKAALLDVLARHTVKKGLISSITLIGNRGDMVRLGEDKEWVGYATSIIEISQDVIVPNSEFRF